MKNRLAKRILAAALCLTMLFTFTACDYENALALFDDTYAIMPLRNTDDNPTFDEMVRSYVHYDYDAFLRYADKTEAAIRAGNEQKAEYMLNNLQKAYLQIEALRFIAEIKYYSDLANEFWLNEFEYTSNIYSLAQERKSALAELTINEDLADDDRNEGANSGELDAATSQKEFEIIEEWTSKFYADPFSQDPEFWEHLTNLLMKLVKLRNEAARAKGYANYAEMVFSNPYKLSKEKIADICEVLAELSPECGRIYSAWVKMEEERKADLGKPTKEEILSNVGKEFLPKVNSDMAEHFSDMEKRGSLVLGEGENAYPNGFMDGIDIYKTEMLYMGLGEFARSYCVLVHEFGHAYAGQVRYDDDIEKGPYYNIDFASLECQSMGLEALFCAKSEELFGWDSGIRFLLSMEHFVPLIENSVLHEVELSLYENEDMTPDELCRMYSDTIEKYGMPQTYEVLNPEDYYCKYGFLFINHFFTSPFYLQQYVPASFVAMQLALMADKDFEKATETYMIIEKYSNAGNYGYEHIVRDAGLVDITDKAAVRAAFRDIFDYYEALLERTDYED